MKNALHIEQETWDYIVKTIGGQRIKALTIHYGAENNFASLDRQKVIDCRGAILLKNSKKIIFCTHKLNNRRTLFEIPIENLCNIFITEYMPGRYWLALAEDSNDDCMGYWSFCIAT